MATAKLSSRERMLAALTRQSPDHVPFSPYVGHGPWFKEPMFWHDQFQRAERMLELGMDPVIDIWMPDVCPGPDVKIKEVKRERDGEKILLTKEFQTPAGNLKQVVHETDDWTTTRHGPWIPTTLGIEKRATYAMHIFDDYNVSRRLEPWVKGQENLEALKHLIQWPTGPALDEWRMDCARASEFAKEKDLLTVFRRTIVGDAYQWFCDIPWFMIQLIDNPQFVKDFFKVFQDWSIEIINEALGLDIDVFQYRGWYETPPFWSPQLMEELIFPNVQKQIDTVHSAGKLHTYLLPEGQGCYSKVLKGVSTDALQGIDPERLHGGNIKDIFDSHGQEKAFWGGVNAEITLESQDAAIIDKAVKDAIEILGANGGLVLSGFIFQEVPQQGLMLMIDAWNKYKSINA